MLGGCSSGQPAKQADEPAPKPAESKPEPPAPVTLTLFADTALRDQDFIDYIQEPTKKKYPHITLVKINKDKDQTMQTLITANQIPDFVWLGLTNIQQLTDLSIPVDLDPIVKRHNYDLSRLDPLLVKSVRSYSPKNELLYMPFRSYAFGLHYNKSIFDRFGVEHPKNNMTWDEIIALARKVTNTADGISYRGLSAGTLLNRMQSQLSLPYVDPAKDQPVISSNPGWKKLFDVFHNIYSIPGNYPQGATFGDGANAFLAARNLAMFPQLLLLGNLDLMKAAGEGFQWGVVSYPTFKENPGVGPGLFSDGFAIPAGSKNPDAAFQVMTNLLSEEVQLMASKKGNLTALTNPDIRKRLFEESPLSKGVDVPALLNLKYADPHKRSPYDEKARVIVTKYVEQAYTGKSDSNTAMRQSDEEIARVIQQDKAAK
jgi:multiple sugar transport system substrate-binding protein